MNEIPKTQSVTEEIFSIIFFMLVIFILGVGIGMSNTEANINNRARELAKQKFTDAISWAISEHILIVNTNKMKELRQSYPNGL